MLIIKKKVKRTYQLLLNQILYLNKKRYKVREIRNILKTSNPKDIVPSVNVSFKFILNQMFFVFNFRFFST